MRAPLGRAYMVWWRARWFVRGVLLQLDSGVHADVHVLADVMFASVRAWLRRVRSAVEKPPVSDRTK